MKEGDIPILNQLAKTLEDSFEKLEKAYDRKDAEEFNRLKGLFVQSQKKLLEALK